ncbi:hypothetical protein FPANT_6127 [Fusarium pseudoanthophilum]|uniref:Uncharacterized protein n=1 Tax=Fusarium pseudoanthophilum TaxID=48495 RepID=A0A8H5P6F7_9HYPO|nr:hypothetical protein FPANT_6127 [Fusarium pseudoanthophilum]
MVKSQRLNPKQLSVWQVTSGQTVNEAWCNAMNAKLEFDAKCNYGATHVTRAINGFAATTYDVLRDFSPMVEIVRDLGAPFGGMAVGTLCCLFAIAKNRVRIEEELHPMLKDIHDRLPAMNMYQHIYNDEHELDHLLQSAVVDAYASFMDYCVAATEFYTQGSLYRVFQSLTSQSMLSLKAEDVKRAVVRVRVCCEDLLGKNVNAIKDQLKDLQTDNIDLQNENDLKTLHHIGSLLGIRAFSTEAHDQQLEKHRSDVVAEFWPRTWHGDQEREKHLSQVLDDAEYQGWIQSHDSGLFIISGENYISGATNCWASLIALNLINKSMGCKHDSSPISVYYLLGHHENDETQFHVISSIIYQLLLQYRNALQDKTQLDELLATLARYQTLSPVEGSHKQNLLQSAALRAIRMLPGGRDIWILVDRVDKCCDELPHSSPGGRRSRKAARTLLRALSSLVKPEGPTVKILAVVNRADWRVEEEADDFEVDGRVLVKRFVQD